MRLGVHHVVGVDGDGVDVLDARCLIYYERDLVK